MVAWLTPYAGLVTLSFAFLLGMVAAYLLYRHHLISTLNRRLPSQPPDDLTALKALNQNLEAKTRALQAKEFELAAANRRLEKLEDAKSKFVTVTAHQLRTPLAAIKWTLNMLAAESADSITAEQKVFIAKASASTERIISIVNDLLRVDKIEMDAADYAFIPVQLEEIIASVIFEFTAQIESKSLRFEFKKPSVALPALRADPIKLRMVFENLIDNAIKYTLPRGQVVIEIDDDRLNATPRSVAVRISDSGIGIKPEDEPKIFQKFFRGGNAISVEPNGSGLGLYIAKDIIERHGGTLWFDSGSTGTAFIIRLPLDRH